MARKKRTHAPPALNDDVKKATLSDCFGYGFSKEHILFDFHYNDPCDMREYSVARIIVTPKTAKMILADMRDLLQRYEKRFGTIKL